MGRFADPQVPPGDGIDRPAPVLESRKGPMVLDAAAALCHDAHVDSKAPAAQSTGSIDPPPIEVI
jgi:hypothetical protein